MDGHTTSEIASRTRTAVIPAPVASLALNIAPGRSVGLAITLDLTETQRWLKMEIPSTMAATRAGATREKCPVLSWNAQASVGTPTMMDIRATLKWALGSGIKLMKESSKFAIAHC